MQFLLIPTKQSKWPFGSKLWQCPLPRHSCKWILMFFALWHYVILALGFVTSWLMLYPRDESALSPPLRKKYTSWPWLWITAHMLGVDILFVCLFVCSNPGFTNKSLLQRICYSHWANGAWNEVISIGQWGVFNHEKGAIWQSHLAAQKEGVVATIIFSNHKTYIQTPLQNTRLCD